MTKLGPIQFGSKWLYFTSRDGSGLLLGSKLSERCELILVERPDGTPDFMRWSATISLVGATMEEALWKMHGDNPQAALGHLYTVLSAGLGGLAAILR